MAKQISVSQQMVDIVEPEHELEISFRGDTLWINVDGVCRLRCAQTRTGLIKLDMEDLGVSLD